MRDRVPRYPGRVTLTPVAGQENTYDMARADDPTEAGTPLNTANLLTAATANAIFNDSADHTVNETLLELATLIRPIAYGGTGASDAAGARTNLGITPANIGAARIQIVSYVGTGTRGQGNPTSVTFNFEPKFLWVSNSGGRALETFGYTNQSSYYLYNAMIAMRGATGTTVWIGGPENEYFTWNGNTVSWYSNTSSASQFNASGETYYALAIG